MHHYHQIHLQLTEMVIKTLPTVQHHRLHTQVSVYNQWRRNEFESGGAHVRRKFFLVVPLLFFFSPTSAISRFGERFHFAVLLTAPPVPSHL